MTWIVAAIAAAWVAAFAYVRARKRRERGDGSWITSDLMGRRWRCRFDDDGSVRRDRIQ